MIYFDNSATTQCSEAAAAKVHEALTEQFGNPSSLHNFGMLGENYIKESREIIAKSLHVTPKEIFFTSGGTEGNNLAIKGAADAYKRRGKHIVTTDIEHAAVLNPFAALEKEGYEATYLGVDEYGVVSLDAVKAAVREDTILVSVMYVNNEIGAVMPIAEIGSYLKKNYPDCIFHVDAIQAFGKFDINPKKLGIDILTVSGHKLHGPKGSGFIYIRDKVRVIPQILGGGQEYGMRSGTENVPAIAGLGVAVAEAMDGLSENREHLFELRNALIDGLSDIEGVSLNGHLDDSNAPHILSVSVDGVRAEVLLHSLEDKGIYVSAGSACSSNKPAISRTLKAIGLDAKLLDSTVRFSFCKNNTLDEVTEAVTVMRELVPQLRKYTRH